MSDERREDTIPTPAELVALFPRLSEAEQLRFMERVLREHEAAERCFVMNHEARLGDQP